MNKAIQNISVLLPVYNGEKYIKQSVSSVLNQTFRNIELVIIDDGSGDNTAELIKEFTDERIRYFRTEHKGTPAALNYGVKKCRYAWIARIDADDLIVPERLEKQAEYLNENPACGVLSAWSVYFKDPAKILFLLKEPLTHQKIYKYLDIHNPINQSAMMIRKSILKDFPFNEKLNSNEDYELMYRIRDDTVFANLPEVLVYTRFRKDSRTNTGERTNLYDMLYRNAFRKMTDSKSKGEVFYWATVSAWLNYFYGDRRDSRSYFRNSFSIKNITALLTTFLPDKYFFMFINSRLRYRLKSIFINKSSFKKQLNNLLKN